MNRRALVAACALAPWLVLGIDVSAQDKVARIGFLGRVAPNSGQREGFREGLRELGYVEGKNLIIEYQWADTVDQLPQLAALLVGMNVDLIFAPVSTFVEPARQATKTIPIVFASHADPIGVGHVQSLAHPGGNITGLSTLAPELSGKQVELLKETVPRLSHMAVLGNSTVPRQRTSVKRDGTRRWGVQGAASIRRRFES